MFSLSSKILAWSPSILELQFLYNFRESIPEWTNFQLCVWYWNTTTDGWTKLKEKKLREGTCKSCVMADNLFARVINFVLKFFSKQEYKIFYPRKRMAILGNYLNFFYKEVIYRRNRWYVRLISLRIFGSNIYSYSTKGGIRAKT